MSPFDLTTLAALKAWLGLPDAAGSQRRDAWRAHYGCEPFDLRRVEPVRPAAAVLHGDNRSRDRARLP